MFLKVLMWKFGNWMLFAAYSKILSYSTAQNTGKYGPEITQYLDTFRAVWVIQITESPNRQNGG